MHALISLLRQFLLPQIQLRRSIFMLATATVLALPAGAQTEFQQCLSGLRSPAKAAGVKEDSVARFTQGLSSDMGILDKLRAGDALLVLTRQRFHEAAGELNRAAGPELPKVVDQRQHHGRVGRRHHGLAAQHAARPRQLVTLR